MRTALLPLFQVFQVALGFNTSTGSWKQASPPFGTEKWLHVVPRQKCHLEQCSPVGNIHIRFLLSTCCVPGIVLGDGEAVRELP